VTRTTRPEPTLLVINSGSSTLKVQLLSPISTEGDGATQFARLWSEQRSWQPQQPQLVDALLDGWLAPLLAAPQQPLQLVGHRVVHGGEQFSAPSRVNAEVLAGLEQLVPLAPLHNVPALQLMRWIHGRLPQLEQWACFDTAFHRTLPPAQHTYAVPADWRERGLRRFGFHGLNHQHVAETVAAIHREEGSSDEQLARLRLISCHLGAGCSLCAISGGHSQATTMGFTPLEGLVMGTRSGSVDPGLLLHLLQQGISAAELDDGLNHRSGLLGLSDLSGDMQQLRQAAAAGHARAQLAIDVFTARLIEGIGAMAAVLRGVDVIALTGGIGQNDELLAHALHSELQWLGPFRLLQIPADEEGQIARQCLAASGLSG